MAGVLGGASPLAVDSQHLNLIGLGDDQAGQEQGPSAKLHALLLEVLLLDLAELHHIAQQQAVPRVLCGPLCGSSVRLGLDSLGWA